MKCPICGKEMIVEDFGGVLVDVWKFGCKGLWFDWMELVKLDEENEGLGAALEEALNQPPSTESHEKIQCPACGIPMYRHIHLRTKEVLVDECGHCGGFFLDSGELRTTRDSYMNDQEEEEYINTQLAEMPDYQEAKADIEKMKKRNEAVRKYTKYIRLSYYVTGR